MSERRLLNCGAAPEPRVRFTFQCPMRWADLEPSDDPRQRLCGQCGEVVYRVHDVVEAGVRADQGECIAAPAWLVDAVRAAQGADAGRIVVGRAASPSELLRRAAAEGNGPA